MSNVLGAIIGFLVILIGLFLLFFLWWSSFIGIVKGIFPLFLILIGAGALIYFLSEMKSKMDLGKEETTSPGEKK